MTTPIGSVVLTDPIQASVDAWRTELQQLGASPSACVLAEALAALQTNEEPRLRGAARYVCCLVLTEGTAVCEPLRPLAAVLRECLAASASAPPTPARFFALADLWNALVCVGAIARDSAAYLAGTAWLATWSDSVTRSLETTLDRAHLALMWLVQGEAAKVAHHAATTWAWGARTESSLVFLYDLVPTFQYMLNPRNAGTAVGGCALRAVVRCQTTLLKARELDDPTLLWLAHVAYGEQLEKPIVTEFLDDLRIAIGNDAALHRPRPLPEQRFAPPEGETFQQGAFRVDNLLWGLLPTQRSVWLGHHTQTGAPVLIAFESTACRVPFATVLSYLGPPVEGTLPLLFLGNSDMCTPSESQWAIVEQIPDGQWIHEVLPADTSNPGPAGQIALEVGLAVAQALQRQPALWTAFGRSLPQAFWVRHVAGRWQLAGFSGGCTVPSTCGPGDAVIPLTVHCYASGDTNHPEQAVVERLALYIIAWATGFYCARLRNYFVHDDPRKASAPVQHVIRTVLTPDVDHQPSLAQFIGLLEAALAGDLQP